MEPRRYSHLKVYRLTYVSAVRVDMIGRKARGECCAAVRPGAEADALMMNDHMRTAGSLQGLHRKPFGQLVQLGYDVTAFTPAAYRRPRLGRPSREI